MGPICLVCHNRTAHNKWVRPIYHHTLLVLLIHQILQHLAICDRHNVIRLDDGVESDGDRRQF